MFQGLEYFIRTVPFHWLNSEKLTYREIKDLSFDLEEMLISCQFNANYCIASDFEEYWSIDYGRCYKFNSGKNNKGN